MRTMTEPWFMRILPLDTAAVTVRPIQPNDARLIDEMHQRLSPDSLYDRYLHPRPPPLDEIEAVCRLEPDQGAGLVATTQHEPASIVGVAYYVRETQADEPTAEPGILVEDLYQGQGIGRRLWQQLFDHARANQICSLRVLSEPDNRRMQRLLQGSGFAYHAQAYGELNEYLVDLGVCSRPSRRLGGQVDRGSEIWN